MKANFKFNGISFSLTSEGRYCVSCTDFVGGKSHNVVIIPNLKADWVRRAIAYVEMHGVEGLRCMIARKNPTGAAHCFNRAKRELDALTEF